jgi:hypothetical protein
MAPAQETDRPEWSDGLVGRLQAFVAQWRNYQGTELEGAQDFLRGLLGCYEVEAPPGKLFEQHPVKIAKKAPQATLFGEPEARTFTAERMDMYLPKVCVWEMKNPREADLQKHHAQILGYWARTRPRYMVLSNFRQIWIYDTDDDDGQLRPKLCFPLAELPARGDALVFLRGEEPDLLSRSERVTSDVAGLLGRMMREVIDQASDPERAREQIAKFVLECVFAMFAEDTELIAPGLFTSVMKRADESGDLRDVWALFDDFGNAIAKERRHAAAPYVNGPLFDRQAPRLTLTPAHLHDLYAAARDFDWQGVRPEIFGSIFEQALDAVERHELGAHYTRESDIARVVGPTVIEPWRARIAAIRNPKDAERVVAEMRQFHVLDPACGCGNFLYVVYREMKRLEAALARKWTVMQRFAAKRRSDVRPPPPGPWFTLAQVHGIEVNGFAAFLARVVLWIGEHLAARELGLDDATLPLKNLDQQVRHGDALSIDWPRPDPAEGGELAIVGNPPYLGVRKLRRELGDAYVDELFARFPKNRAADYVTYWFTRALSVLGPGERAGYVCTNSVAQNESREASIDQVLAAGGTLTDAWRSYPWPGEAAVHIAIVNWVMAPWEGLLTLDGAEVRSISPGLTEAVDVTAARRLAGNAGICFMGVTPGNAEFVLTDEERAEILARDPGSAPVIRPFLIGRDVNRELDQRPTRWIIDFGAMPKEEAEAYVGAMRHVRKHVYPIRKDNRREIYAERWWRFVEARPGLRSALSGLEHALVIPCVAPHLIVTRQPADICFDHQLMVLALSDAYHFGLLQSKLHATWAWARGSTLEERLRYTNTTIFETFPFPLLPKERYEPRERPKTKAADRLATAASLFDGLRRAACKEQGLGLTKLHNALRAGDASPLGAAYAAMNDAACAAYGFPEATWRDERDTLRRLVLLNHELSGALPAG